MKILNTLEDDFPCPASSTVNSRKYYEAFLKAEEILKATPTKHKEAAENSLAELTSYFYSEGDTTQALYRKQETASDVLVGLWLSEVRNIANWYAAANSTPIFKGIDKSTLVSLPRNFKEPKNLKRIEPFLANEGVIFVYKNAFPAMKLDGAVFSIPSGQIVVALSLRYSRLDYFWFTLLHELAHVVLHADHLNSPIIDNLEITSASIQEKQADRLALDSLIPRNEWRSCPARFTHSSADVINFANRLGIPAQCVAGRLQRELNRYELFAEIINEFNVKEILGADKQ
ncbi:ImmA/IrrE family metallo-endopeptidase [Comamonas sp. JNW]|uniref:ImmA/IrrE family metallo-endopeptidase n=1 Tax=Comamonas sp. JNW TaxID=2170731 RepID=UPI000DE6923A|nr:ImmA/IrrE family metallo-endopeptidase [Comamonas sp. JNW]PWB18366.1 hypothetical protein DCO45_10390 [Comamonas sp. JNW]